MSAQKYSSKEAVEAIVGQYQRAEEKRADMVRITTDGGSIEADFDMKRVTVEPDDFTKGKNTLAFHFTDKEGNDKFIKLAMKWSVQIKEVLEAAGGAARLVIIRHGLGIQDTTYEIKAVE